MGDQLNLLGSHTISLFRRYVESLPLYDKYLLEQYTHHGDIIINTFLRGDDTIHTYAGNIIYPDYNIWVADFVCLFLKEIYDEVHEGNVKIDIIENYFQVKKIRDIRDPFVNNRENEKKLIAFRELYKNDIYSHIETKLHADDIEYFRRLTYTIVKKLYMIITKAPHSDKVFTVYRGVKSLYLDPDPTTISKLTSFHSTTFDYEQALGFGKNGYIYIFKVHPDCRYIYLESLTIHNEEEEILFTPGNRYAFVSEEEGVLTFVVLPPERGYKFPETYDAYKKYLRTIAKENELAKNNKLLLARVRPPMARRGGTRRRISRTRATRRRKSMKQRGGEGTEENRWNDSEPVIEVTNQTAKDKRMIENILRGTV